jgi:hypothetical protein
MNFRRVVLVTLLLPSMVKFLRPDKNLEGTVLDLGHTLGGCAFA